MLTNKLLGGNVVHLPRTDTQTSIERMNKAVLRMKEVTASVVADTVNLDRKLSELDEQLQVMSDTLGRCDRIYTASIQKLTASRIKDGNNST